MARTFKQPPRQNLSKIPILIEDTRHYSAYFDISQLNWNRTFHAGKNGFLIRGTSFLKQDSGILIEIVDRFNSPVFVNPIVGVSEGGSRLVSVEIFQETERGPGKLIILGTAETYIDGRPIPASWKDRPNVRWEIPIQIEPRNRNVTEIRLANSPIATVAENNFNTTRIDSTTVTDSLYKASLQYDYATHKSDGYAITMLDSNDVPVSFFDTVNVDGMFSGSLFKRVIETSSAGTITTVSGG